MKIEHKIVKQIFDGEKFKKETFVAVTYSSDLFLLLKEKFKNPKYLGEYWTSNAFIYMNEKTFVLISLMT